MTNNFKFNLAEVELSHSLSASLKSESPEEINFPKKSNGLDQHDRKKLYIEKLKAGENTSLCEIGFDVIIKVRNHYFKAHKMILEARCEYFRAMFTHGFFNETSGKVFFENVPVIEIKDIEPEYFYSIHTYIYTDEVVVYRK
jgi:hypothetical protein